MNQTIAETTDYLSDLNPGQRLAAEKIRRFLLSRDKEFVLSGAGGTGKTYLTEKIIKDVLPQAKQVAKLMGNTLPDWDVCLTATTNKAATVLASATGRTAGTIHSHISVKPYTDYQTGQVKLSPRKNVWRVLSNQLIFCDEASMIETSLLSWIRKSTDDSCKIIFMGDHCQMDPIGESFSPVFSNPKNFAVLDQPMRNSGQPALIRLCAQMRHAVEHDEFFPIPSVPGVIDHLNASQAQAEVESHFATEREYSRILAYTNDRVNYYNDFIRPLRGRPDRLVKGECVINNSMVQFKNSILHPEMELKIINVDERPFVIYFSRSKNPVKLECYSVSLESECKDRYNNVSVPVNRIDYKNALNVLKGKKDWASYYYLKESIPDLRPRDSATVYKAQGSTYDTVYVDLQDLSKSQTRLHLARMLYVAVSRARQRVAFFGELPNHIY